MIEDPKTGLKIMTKEEYDEFITYWFDRGVKRGRIEKANEDYREDYRS